MFAAEIPGRGFRLVIGDQVDAALAPEFNILGAVTRHFRETDGFEHFLEVALFRGGELNELEAIKPGGVVKQVGHGSLL